MQGVPAARVRPLNGAPVRPRGRFVLHWMTAFRRTGSNFSLQRAAERAEELGRPLLVLEALRCDYPFASDRIHRFVMDGMADNARALGKGPARHHPYVEPAPGEGRGLLEALAAEACLVVADDSPASFLPRMTAAAAERLPVLLEAVDGNGLLPMAAADRAYPTAHGFRRLQQRELPSHLAAAPARSPLAGRRIPPLRRLPAGVARRWPAADLRALSGPLAALPIDHAVGPVALRGGSGAARRALREFVAAALPRYADGARHPDLGATSGLSPWLHFGHIGIHEVLEAVTAGEDWSPRDLSTRATGSRTGWWGLPPATEAFLDQAVTWREVGINMAFRGPPGYDGYEALPAWARETLEDHASDVRPAILSMEDLAAARTGDRVWNAAQRQLLREGRIHNYLRMVWGKRLLEWTPGPREALAAMYALNDRYALDGRDPNSVSGITWCLGRYDRAWGPERRIFGKVRYMSSAATERKLRMRGYMERFGEPGPGSGARQGPGIPGRG